MSDTGQEDPCWDLTQKGLYHKQFLRVVYGSVMLGAMDGIRHNIKKSASQLLPICQNYLYVRITYNTFLKILKYGAHPTSADSSGAISLRQNINLPGDLNEEPRFKAVVLKILPSMNFSLQ